MLIQTSPPDFDLQHYFISFSMTLICMHRLIQILFRSTKRSTFYCQLFLGTEWLFVYVLFYTCVSLFSLFTPPAISAISSRDTHIPICSRGPTGTRFPWWAWWPGDTADQTRRSFPFAVKQLSEDTVAQTDCSHQCQHLHIWKCKQKQNKTQNKHLFNVLIKNIRIVSSGRELNVLCFEVLSRPTP